MKKMKFLLGTAAVLGAGACAVLDLVHRALIDRNFEVPESITDFMSEVETSDRESITDECMQWMLDYGFQRHYMVNKDGNKLVGYLMTPKEKSNVYVFASHGYKSDGKGEWCYFAKHYVEELGYNLFFVDHQAAGESEGKNIGFGSFESRDGLQWLSYLNDTFGIGIEIILHGISMGSATVMLMCGSEDLPENVKFAIADCGFTSAMDEFTYKLQSLKIPSVPIVPLANEINKIKAKYDFKKDTNALQSVANAKVPMLFIHGNKDKFVPTYMVYLLYDACSSEYKDILVVDGADHAESYNTNKAEYETKMDEFIEKFIDESKVTQ